MSAEEIDYLSVEDLLEIAAGVIDHVVVRDAGLLAAAAARPRVTVFGEDAYRAFEDKAAALLHSLVRNHALVDGNKRLAWSAARIFCLLNGRDLTRITAPTRAYSADGRRRRVRGRTASRTWTGPGPATGLVPRVPRTGVRGRRSRTAEITEGPGDGTAAARHDDQLVGQYPLREVLHASGL